MCVKTITLTVEFDHLVSDEFWEMLVDQLVTVGSTTGAEIVAVVDTPPPFEDINERGDEDG